VPHQLYLMLGFMTHRIGKAMRPLAPTPLGGEGKIVEADETCYGRAKQKHKLKKRYTPHTKAGWKGKGSTRPIAALGERGSVRSFHAPVADKIIVTKIVQENIARESRLHT
jgi:hypothetical protein